VHVRKNLTLTDFAFDVTTYTLGRVCRMDQSIINAAFKAAEAGDASQVAQLVGETPSMANAENADGLTLLGYAAHFGHPEVVGKLLDAGADIHAVSHSKLSFIPSNTALHAAIAGNHGHAVVELLINAGADVNAVDSLGHTPLEAAAFEGNLNILQLLLAHGANGIDGAQEMEAAVSIATKRGHHEFVKALQSVKA
jgi:uncharacterized protein